jgi:hypothetical protein
MHGQEGLEGFEERISVALGRPFFLGDLVQLAVGCNGFSTTLS